ncbi:GNAT family N-acetyltransferase [Mammaliicoccus sp. Dog046]|uniref:GNAT family N-acetyltransferase n=1 Tax=Mammaliicoccus sp. Dog046 TaxID=3034233 RepID=UPI002B262303|nr:GNAT family N-acetyltransferase [Mammaliicoccus sp. Dog046]WQK85952.1 GNAT family N-acetyltransferase [Mammaliicoccus sp. Dog046]
MVTFSDIETDGDILEDTDRYTHFQTLHKRIQYDSNKIVYKQMPDLETFKNDEHMLKKLHEQHEQPFLKFVFPENEMIDDQLGSYLKEQGYEYSWIELYINHDKDFHTKHNEAIEVVETNDDNLVDFMNLSYEFDKEYGEDYAELKITTNKEQFAATNPIQVIAYYKDKPAGILLVWKQAHYVEIDSFAVDESLRRKGIGTEMQAYVSKIAQDKPIILVADGEDTAKDMYQAQGYKYSGFQYEALKEY